MDNKIKSFSENNKYKLGSAKISSKKLSFKFGFSFNSAQIYYRWSKINPAVYVEFKMQQACIRLWRMLKIPELG